MEYWSIGVVEYWKYSANCNKFLALKCPQSLQSGLIQKKQHEKSLDLKFIFNDVISQIKVVHN
jgi:hypothetical protein